MIILFGTRYLTWGDERTPTVWHCPNCEHDDRFIRKRGRRALTLFFLLPVIPLGRVERFTECPRCGARYIEPDAA
jgi:predicted RNA-binding Zn-ribbon protein involved in translation (DUF1610 family)